MDGRGGEHAAALRQVCGDALDARRGHPGNRAHYYQPSRAEIRRTTPSHLTRNVARRRARACGRRAPMTTAPGPRSPGSRTSALRVRAAGGAARSACTSIATARRRAAITSTGVCPCGHRWVEQLHRVVPALPSKRRNDTLRKMGLRPYILGRRQSPRRARSARDAGFRCHPRGRARTRAPPQRRCSGRPRASTTSASAAASSGSCSRQSAVRGGDQELRLAHLELAVSTSGRKTFPPRSLPLRKSQRNPLTQPSNGDLVVPR
jgi:hypothetical protein